MKKILFLLLLIPFNVFAINYSPYSKYKYTENPVKENELCEVEELKKYKFYKLEKDYTDNYFNSSYQDDYYIYQDSNFIYSDLISSNIKPKIDEVTEIDEKTLTYYQEYNKLRYINFNNFDYSDYLYIKEIYIYDKNNKKIKFDIVKGPSKIGDNNSSTSSKIMKDDIIILKLEKDMEFKNMYFYVITSGLYPSTFSFDYNLNYTGDIDDKYYYGNINGQLSSENRYYVWEKDANYIANLNSEIKVKEGYFENIKNAKIIKYETIYSYREKLYKYYKYKKIYLDDYYFDKENYIKDLDNYKIIYRYRCRTILNNVVENDKIGFNSKNEYLEFKNKKDEVINKISINKTITPLKTEIMNNNVINVDKNIESCSETEISVIDIKDKENDIDKIKDNSNKLYKFIIIIFGLLIIFVI